MTVARSGLSGDATIYGKSIVTDMSGVRQDIGFCPQHDVLYPDLTVTEHLAVRRPHPHRRRFDRRTSIVECL